VSQPIERSHEGAPLAVCGSPTLPYNHLYSQGIRLTPTLPDSGGRAEQGRRFPTNPF
jgi:hypothetical protein